MALGHRRWSPKVLVLAALALTGLYMVFSSGRLGTTETASPILLVEEETEDIAPGAEVPRIKVIDGDPAKAQKARIQQHGGACRIPKLEVNGSEVIQFYKKIAPLDCTQGGKNPPHWLRLDEEGRLQLTDYAKNNLAADSIKCELQFYFRVTDAKLSWSTQDYVIGEPVDKGDYFLAKCNNTDGRKWENLFMTIVPRKDVLERLQKAERPAPWSGLNVHFLGFDSLSQMSVRRNLPKTVEFLEKTLGSVVLNGYNIVGDGTPQAFIPILTSQTEEELPLTRRRYAEAKFVDVYPFIWRNFSKAGYATLYGEDAANIGTFTYRLKGFKEQPTDHYTRTFFQYNEKHEKDWKCIGSEPQQWQWFRYAEEFHRRYPAGVPKFLLMHHSILSHDDINLAQVLDDDLEAHLRRMYESGAFDNSLVIVMADHGHRFAKLRDTQQGQLEERLPFFSVSLPKKFRESEKGAKAFENLKTNANRLSSPFDIYSTLADLLEWPTNEQLSTVQDPSTHRSLSLFRPIPEERTCEQAGIAPHWCTCLDWQSAMADAKVYNTSTMLAKVAVQVMNDKTRPERKLCAPLRLKELLDAKRLVPQDGVLKYNGVKDVDGFDPKLEGHTQATFATYQLKFTTTPGDAKYEVTLQYDAVRNEATVDLTAVSHVNAYGDLPHCIIDKNYFLAAYCVCYDKIKAPSSG